MLYKQLLMNLVGKKLYPNSDMLFVFFQLLRSSLVNNRTQAVVCDDLGMAEYIINTDHRSSDKGELKMKEKADLVEGG